MSAETSSSAQTGASPSGVPRWPGLTLAVIVGVEMILMLDMTVLNIALPSIREDLGFTPTGLAWVVNAFALTFGGLLLLGGRAGDILGRRRVFVAGVLIFTFASLLGGLAVSAEMLIAARALQGVGAALAGPSTLALLMTHFEEGPPRNRALAVYSAVTGSAMALGLLVGGVITFLVSWRWVLLINVPIGIAVAVLAPLALREAQRNQGRFDLGGALTSTAGLVALVYGFLRAAEGQWADPVTIACFVAGVALLAVFVLIESKAGQPIMPLRLFAERSRAAAFLNMLLVPATLFAMFFFLVQYLQEVLGQSPIVAGLSFLPMAVSVFLGAQIVLKFVPKLGPKPIAAAGVTLISLAALWLTLLDPAGGYLTGVLGPMLLFGIGVGFSVVPLNMIIVSGVPAQDSGAASGLLQALQQIGGALGLAVLVAVFGAASRAAEATGADSAGVLTEGISSAFLVGSAFTLVALVATVIGVHGAKTKQAAAG
ncbi:MFS transporter [Nocardiopsis exhalans]|uniref:MFS transporter n=1 Tax=Nocardiopsis exhalans TaxID=163604 RepID=A0ABY5D349_9ACTN|nr:MFS transporter [Nocardiopsis exhalans]USY18405.1 MFS transporter [Nocardiopsis exhalans]